MTLKTVEELQELIENNDEYGGCAVSLPDGSCIGTTSGGFQPLYYINEDDRTPLRISWEKALQLYNKAVSQHTVVYQVSAEESDEVVNSINEFADPEDVDGLVYGWLNGNITKEDIYMKIRKNMY